MPNGYDKNWIRVCAAIDGFRARYGIWPTRLLLDKVILSDLQSLFTTESFEIIQEKISLSAIDGIGVIAEDDEGRSYDYGKCGFTKEEVDIRAKEWLGVYPDIDFGY